jgi:predicted transcriptional regulator
MKRKNSLNKLDILSEIYIKFEKNKFVTMEELIATTGLSSSKIRPFVEDLKEDLLIVEHPEGFQVSNKGITFCKTHWA